VNDAEKTRESWNNHYQKDKSIQKYPDENLVRLIPDLNSFSQTISDADSAQHTRALDLGCGSGRHFGLLHEKGYSEICGLDISENSVQICSRLYSFAKTDLLVLPSGNAPSPLHLPFKDDFFSIVILWGVLHYNQENIRSQMLAEVRRIVQPGGLVIGTVRSDKDTHFKKNPDINDAQIFFFSESEVRDMLSGFFTEIELGYAERSPVGRLEERVAHWIFRAAVQKQ
jgi:SAM-dependent methyltransferase